MRNDASQSGQTIVLFALGLLMVTVMTFFTISVGNRVQQKIKAQAAADASAYGLAVAQARAMNVMALSNRAIVGEYVSALSVVGHISWMDTYEWTFDAQADIWQRMKAQKNAECAAYQGCHAAPNPPGSATGRNSPSCKTPVVCCKGKNGGCCDPCDHYDCWAAACSVPDALFDEMSNRWYSQGFPGVGAAGSFLSIHNRWHNAPKQEIMKMANYASDYVGEAKRASDNGRKVFLDYYNLLNNETYTRGVARSVDPRLTAAHVATTNLAGGGFATMTGARDNLFDSVQIFPKTTGADLIKKSLNNPAQSDFDVFNEILTGTRGGGRNNSNGGAMVMAWETQHGVGPGYFDPDAAKVPSICAKGQYHPSFWKTYACGSSWDQNNGVNKLQGGEMMLDAAPNNAGHIHNVNAGNQHNYPNGTLGGPRALSADDYASTSAFFDVETISCPGDTNNQLSLWTTPQRSLVCLGDTLYHETNLGEVSNGGALDCIETHVIPGGPKGPSADINPNSPYFLGNGNWSNYTFKFGNCGSADTEWGFFRFDIKMKPKANPADPWAPEDLFNQPFTYAATEIDAAHDPNGNKYPWDFHFGKIGGSMLTLDQTTDYDGTQRGATNTSKRDGTRFTGSGAGMNTEAYPKVRGWAAGLSYYHNPLNWQEVPNLFNPYWRARLAAPGKRAAESLGAISAEDKKVGQDIGWK